MLKKYLTITSSLVRDFKNISLNVLPDSYVFSFYLKNIDNSEYKFKIDNESFVTKKSQIFFSQQIQSFNSSFSLKVQKNKVKEVITNLKINDTYNNFFDGLNTIEVAVFLNCNFLGNISDISDSVNRLELTGSSVNSFDLNELPISLTELKVSGDFEINSYTRRNWLNNIKTFVLENEKGNGLSQQDVDNLLEDLSKTTLNSSCVIRILGNNSSPSSNGLVFKNLLISQGVLVQTN